jgi:chromosome segregation ATPase
MDGTIIAPVIALVPDSPRTRFRSPPRILIPKLVKSRDHWKASSLLRKHHLKLAQLKIRDLSRSRDTWKSRHRQLQEQNRELQEQNRELQEQFDRHRAELESAADQKKADTPG